MDYRRTYQSAAAGFCDLVARVPADRWDDAGLGEWSLRDLIGHTVSSALRQVPTVLFAPAATVSVGSPEAYWAFARTAPPEMYAAAVAASTDDARETGKSLGSDAVNVVEDLARRATAALAAVGDDDVVATPIGGMRVRDWISTRTFELVVHGMDVAEAADVSGEFAPAAVAHTAVLAARIAAAVGDGPLVVRALTGRGRLSEGFSVV